MFATAIFHESLLDTHLIVDARTPLEYEEDHIPGSINVPLLSNEERVEIGILYKQTGPLEARIRGLELTAHRFPVMIAEIAASAEGRPILVYCWRGGLRSKTIAAILELAGYNATQLAGGYKAFRRHVDAFFNPFRPPGPLIVLHGMTGVGKTTFLHGFSGKGFRIVDLEGLANHRGSAFGELGLTQALSQKRFDTLLWNEFRIIAPGKSVILEGESRRIGKVSLPGNLYEVMGESIKVWCDASIETRVKRLVKEYGLAEYRPEMMTALCRIRKKLGGEKFAEISGYLSRWEMEPFMKELMSSYYDKVYYKTKDWLNDFTISLEDFKEAEKELVKFLNSLGNNI